jgi:hypothetical protein
MPLGKRVQALPGNELLRDLPLELNAVGTLSGHGFHPLKAQLTLSNSLTSNCPAPGAHSTETSRRDPAKSAYEAKAVVRRTSSEDRVWTPLGHETAVFAAMHGRDLLCSLRDPWP